MADVSALFWPFVHMMATERASYEDVFVSDVYHAFCDACDVGRGGAGLFLCRDALEPLDIDLDSVRAGAASWWYDPDEDGWWTANATVLFELAIALLERHAEMRPYEDAMERARVVRACRDRMVEYISVSDAADALGSWRF